MRIALVSADRGIPLDGTKGASVHLRSLAEALHHRGHEVTVYTPSPAATDTHVRARPVEALLVDAHAGGPPDLVYERYSLGHEDGLRAAGLLDVPFALEVNAPLVLEAGRHRPHTLREHHRQAEARLFRGADLVFAVSEPLRRHVERLRGHGRGTAVLRNGFAPEHFPVPAPLGGEVVGFLGHPKPWHGADRLPGLVAELRRRGRPARLVVIGGGPGADAMRAEAARVGVADVIDITGPVPAPEAARRLLEAAVTVAPYPPDPFFYFCPLKVVESMAAGIPVVAPTQGDIPEIVGPAGLLVPPGDDAAMADAVEELLADPALRRKVGARARRRAFAGFTWSDVAERAIDAVNALRRERVA